jgi:membrane-bound lytic murein transglycosylase D
VQRGDTLWDIANKYDGVTVDDLKKLNGTVNTKKLKLGQKIKIQKI